MSHPIKILVVEDNPVDAELLVHELRRTGFAPEWRVVDTEAAYIAALHPGLDVVFSDSAMPSFSGAQALTILQERVPTVPFILVSGTIGEETAVDAMRLGAADYLLKDRLVGRLGAAVLRAMSQGRLRRERLAAEEATARIEAKYRSIFEHSVEGLYQTTVDGRLVIANPMLARIAGYASAEEMIADVTDVGEQFYVNPVDRERFLEQMRTTGTVRGFEAEMRRRDGALIWISSDARVVRDEAGNVVHEGALRDITERKRAEEEIRRQIDELQRWHDVTLGREERIIALKREVNALLVAAGAPPRYEGGVT